MDAGMFSHRKTGRGDIAFGMGASILTHVTVLCLAIFLPAFQPSPRSLPFTATTVQLVGAEDLGGGAPMKAKKEGAGKKAPEPAKGAKSKDAPGGSEKSASSAKASDVVPVKRLKMDEHGSEAKIEKYASADVPVALKKPAPSVEDSVDRMIPKPKPEPKPKPAPPPKPEPVKKQPQEKSKLVEKTEKKETPPPQTEASVKASEAKQAKEAAAKEAKEAAAREAKEAAAKEAKEAKEAAAKEAKEAAAKEAKEAAAREAKEAAAKEAKEAAAKEAKEAAAKEAKEAAAKEAKASSDGKGAADGKAGGKGGADQKGGKDAKATGDGASGAGGKGSSTAAKGAGESGSGAEGGAGTAGKGSGAGNSEGGSPATGSGQDNSAQIGLARQMYYKAIYNIIRKQWRLPESAKTDSLEAILIVVVRRDGKVLDIRFEKKSGDALFDESVIRAVRKSDPLPPFPAVYTAPQEEIGLRFRPEDMA